MSLSPRQVVLAALGASLFAPSAAHAQALFTVPGDVRITEIHDAVVGSIGTDKLGFAWAYGNGGIYCYDPADHSGPDGTPSPIRAYGAFDHVGISQAQVYLDPGWDGPLSYEGLYLPNPDYEPGGPQLQFQPYRCTPADAPPTAWRVPLPTQPEWDVQNLGAGAWQSQNVFLHAGHLCAFQGFGISGYRDPRPNGRLMCLDFPAGGVPVASFPLAGIDLDTQLGVPSWEATYPDQPKVIAYAYGGNTGQSYIGPPFEGWTFAAPLVTTEGRVFFIATRQTAIFTPQNGGGYGYPRWVLELKADGTISPRLVPAAIRSGAASPIGLGLFWHQATRSILAVAEGSYEFGNYILCGGGDGMGNLVCAPRGPGGNGFFYLPLERRGFGYFSVRDVMARGVKCVHDDAHGGCTLYTPNVIPDPAGRLVLRYINRQYNSDGALAGWKDVLDSLRYFQLDFDPSTFDIDGDGLTAAAEDALGTSDYEGDSDRGYTADSVEVGILASDPTDPDDDLYRFDQDLLPEPSGYGTSRLVRAWLPQDVSDYSDSRVTSLSPDGPLCFGGRCLDIHAHEAMTFPDDASVSDLVVSADASFLAFRVGTALERKIFSRPDEAAETYVQPGEFERFLGASPPHGRLYPISRALTYWVQTSAPPVVIAFDAQGKGSLVFDLLAAGCDSKLGACAPEPVIHVQVGDTDALDELFPEIEPVGYAAATRRLLVGAKTNWRQFFIALEAGKPPVLVGSQSTYNFIPSWFTPTGHGHDYVEFLGTPRMLTSNLDLLERPIAGLEVWAIGSPRSYWGDVTLVQAWTGGSYGSQLPSGALEAVWFPPEVAPGEVLAFDPYSAKLARIGLRGGAFIAWSLPEPTEHGVTGIDVTADLRMCAANPRVGRVREYLPRFGRGAPSVTEAPDIVMPDAAHPSAVWHPIDCAYGDDGALRVLVADPPAVWVRAPGQEAFVIDATAKVPAAPKRFIRGPGGKGFVAIAGADDAAAGRLVTRAGVVVDIPKHSWDLRWNGVVVANLRQAMYWDWQNGGPNNYPEIPGDVAMVERADGRIVLVMQGGFEFISGAPFIFEPRSGRVYQAAEGAAGGSLLAVVPGGDNVDPWTGDRLGPPVPAMLQGAAAPVATPAPEGGIALPPTAPSGCAGGEGGAGVALALASLASLVWGRGRGRHEPLS